MFETLAAGPMPSLIATALLLALGASKVEEGSLLQTVSTQRSEQQMRFGAVIFYNLFIGTAEDIPRVALMVKEQFSMIEDVTDKDIRINSIGAPVTVSDLNLSSELQQRTNLMAHYAQGWEDLTLHDLWSFCREKDTDPDQLVVYLHSKGSYNERRGKNAKKRAYLTKGALSQECLQMPKDCNICSTRMTPIPYAQTPGNMWAARCGYVAKLKDPRNFDKDMLDVPYGQLTELELCVGSNRFAFEHWVQSHPDAAPCDLDTNVKYPGWGPVPSSSFSKELKKAPRFDLSIYVSAVWKKSECAGWGQTLQGRLAEYRVLYGTEPSADWWGWKFFKTS